MEASILLFIPFRGSFLQHINRSPLNESRCRQGGVVYERRRRGRRGCNDLEHGRGTAEVECMVMINGWMDD